MDNNLNKLQNIELNILKDVDKICKNNNINYYLIAGSLLGAVRHKAFIPWDDDIDIAMPRDDYEKFLSLYPDGNIDNKYFLQNIKTDNRYNLTFSKVRKNNTLFDEEGSMGKHKGIFIDIFPLDYTKNSTGLFYKIKRRLVKDLTHIAYIRTTGGKTVSVINKILYIMTRPLSVKQLILIRDKIAISKNKKSYIVNYSSWYDIKKECYPIEYWEPYTEVIFEGEKFRAPAKKELILKQIYGDYMKLPPESERYNHNPAKIIFDFNEEKNEKK